MGRTSIQWSGFSVNPIRARRKGSTATRGGYNSGVGHYCEKISAGCKKCYASASQPRFGLPIFQEQRGEVEVFFDASKLEEVLRRKTPTKWFWCDMTDMFGHWVPNEWIAAIFGVMAATPQHTFQVLTKRAERMHEWFEWVAKRANDGLSMFPDDPVSWRVGQMLAWTLRKQYGIDGQRAGTKSTGWEAFDPRHQPWPLPNVHLGVSVEDQETADERIPQLLATPAAVRWVSYEPALGPVDFDRFWRDRLLPGNTWAPCLCEEIDPSDRPCAPCMAQRGLDWIVVGGESGPSARPFDIAWARSTVEQCRAVGVACFVKQLGARPYDGATAEPTGNFRTHEGRRQMEMKATNLALRNKKGGDMSEWPEDLRVREFPGGRSEEENDDSCSGCGAPAGEPCQCQSDGVDPGACPGCGGHCVRACR